MKIKQHVFVTDTLEFAKGNYSCCFNLYGTKGSTPDSWLYVGEIEIDVKCSVAGAKRIAIEGIEEKKKQATADYSVLMDALEHEKQSLLCLEHTEALEKANERT